jgi:hypothetical protein
MNSYNANIKVGKDEVLKDNTEKNIEDDISTEDSEERFYARYGNVQCVVQQEKVHFSQNHPFNKVLYKNVITLYI